MTFRLPTILALGVTLAASAASATIALFTDGRPLKIASSHLRDEASIELSLKSGGTITVPLARVDRIIDDEVVPVAVVAEVKKAIAVEGAVFPNRPLHYNEASGRIFKTRYDKMIVAAAKKFDVDAALISAVIKAESDFNPREVSNKGARGLMQLMPATAERFGVTDSFDPAANINAGARYLHWLLETFHDDADLAVAA